MIERPSIQPPLAGGDEVTQEHLAVHVRQWRTDTAQTLEGLTELRRQVEENSGQLENPKAAVEYLEFFAGFFTRAAEDLAAISQQLAEGPKVELADRMRQLANNAAAEQRRTVAFRDKWVNKPLPHEQLRPMLTRLASDVRDQLADYRDLIAAAKRLAELAPPPPPPEPKAAAFDRRALFRRIVKPLGDDEPVGGGSGGSGDER